MADWLGAKAAAQLVSPGYTHIVPLVHHGGAPSLLDLVGASAVETSPTHFAHPSKFATWAELAGAFTRRNRTPRSRVPGWPGPTQSENTLAAARSVTGTIAMCVSPRDRLYELLARPVHRHDLGRISKGRGLSPSLVKRSRIEEGAPAPPGVPRLDGLKPSSTQNP